jgi:hypothetical protein
VLLNRSVRLNPGRYLSGTAGNSQTPWGAQKKGPREAGARKHWNRAALAGRPRQAAGVAGEGRLSGLTRAAAWFSSRTASQISSR